MIRNPHAKIPEKMQVTQAAAEFVASVHFDDIPDQAVRNAIRCIMDGMGLFVAGSEEACTKILIDEALGQGGSPEALLLGCADVMVPAPVAARVLGTAAHAHDWDDTQVSRDPEHVYGLLTHPTTPVLASALAGSQMLGRTTGRELLLAFLAGFEVECKVSEWMLPEHYTRGFHSTGTVGTLGAMAAGAKLMGLTSGQTAHGLGLAASMAAGIRANFGTMTKPLHAGRAAENGLTAAILASKGFTADQEALDGPWGFFAVHGGGVQKEKMAQGFGRTWSIIDPGVSIKPYPCGVLTHPSMDLMRNMVVENDIRPEEIESITLHAGSNILNPIRYPIAGNHLQAKFSLPAGLAMMVLCRKAGKDEFCDSFVQSRAMQAMQRRIRTEHDPEIESCGFERMRSRITLHLTGGREISGRTDTPYRGGPDNPLTDAELEDKVRSCCRGILDDVQQDQLIKRVWSLPSMEDVRILARDIQDTRLA
jgi:2-methylcitrate dehydratase PrpD